MHVDEDIVDVYAQADMYVARMTARARRINRAFEPRLRLIATLPRALMSKERSEFYCHPGRDWRSMPRFLDSGNYR